MTDTTQTKDYRDLIALGATHKEAMAQIQIFNS